MNEAQRQIIEDFIDIQSSKTLEHLLDLGLLDEPRNTLDGLYLMPLIGAQEADLEQWFFDTIDSDDYLLIADSDEGVRVSLEVGPFDSRTGNPIVFEFEAAAWPSLLEEAVMVLVENGVVSRPDVFIEPHIMVDICGDNNAASYEDLFLFGAGNGDLGAIADLPGMEQTTYWPTALQDFVGTLIDAEQNNLLTAVLEYACALVNTDENGEITPASRAEVVDWLGRNGLMESLQRIVQSGEVGS